MRGSTRGSSATGKTVIADTGAILAGAPLLQSCVTTELVVQEVKDEASRQVLERAIASGKLEVRSPSQKHFEKARSLAKAMGLRLSEADLSVFALALEAAEGGVDVVVLTDDKMLQLALARSGIEVKGLRYGRVREAERE